METAQRNTAATLVAAVVGVALFSSAKWIMLDDTAGFSISATYLSRIVGILTFVASAVMFRDHLPRVGNVVRLMACFIAVYLVSSALAAVSPDKALATVIHYAAGVLYGIAGSLFILLYAQLYSCASPRVSAVLFAVSQLATTCLMVVFSFVDAGTLPLLRGGFVAVGTAMLSTVALSRRDEGGVGMLSFSTGDDEARSAVRAAERVFPVREVDWAFVLVASFAFHGLFGIVSRVSSVTGGSFALYDVPTDVILILIEILVIVFLSYYGAKFDIAVVLVAIGAMYATGLAIYANLWSLGSPLAGALVRGGYDCTSIFMFSLMARKTYADPARSYLYFGLYRSVSSAYPGRLIGGALLGLGIPQAQLVGLVAQGALLTICMLSLAAFLLANRNRPAGPLPPTSRSVAEEPSGGTDERNPAEGIPTGPKNGGPAVDGFSARLDALARRAGLTERETEVVVETLHGQNRNSVAQKLCLSPETVKKYLSRVYAKIGVSSKQELVARIEAEDPHGPDAPSQRPPV